MSNHTTVGIDIAKDKFDAAILADSEGKQATKQFRRTIDGFAKLQDWLRQRGLQEAHVGMEATSCYWQDLAVSLHEQGWAVSVINPAQIKAYAKARGLRNKSDRVDAKVIAEFLQAQKPALWSPPSPERLRLQHLVRRQRQLREFQGQENNRLQQTSDPTIAQSIRSSLTWVESQLNELQREIRKHVKSHPKLARDCKLLQSIQGIGETTAQIILAELPEDIRDPRQAAAFAGLTPQRRDSGHSSLPSRLSKIGSKFLRQALYMPAIVAARHNPVLHKIAENLKANSKPKKAITAAIMHRLIRIAVGVLKSQKPFDPSYFGA